MIVRRRAFLASLAALALSGSRAFAQGDAVDQAVRAEMDQRHIPGVSLAIVKGGAIVKSAAYGRMRVSPDEPAAPATIYKLDSVTKQFTASGIMILVQRGQVRLDDPVKTYLPNAPSSWDAITIRNLLTHTSGLAHDPPSGYPPVAVQNTHPGAMLGRLFQMQPLFEPGSRYAYSNSGYSALAAVIQLVTGEPYLRFMRERIFDPAGMSNTGLDFMRRPDAARSTGYFWDWSGWSASRARTTTMGAGGIQSSVFDLARWDAALDTDAILTAQSKRAMWSPFRLTDGRWHPYGFAWAIRELPGGKVVFHNGGGDGFNNAFYRFLDARLTVIVLTNLNPNRERGSHADLLARQIAPLYNPALVFPERHHPPLNQPS
ncbi:MAG: serine hydrolase domain-containing protein [Candidatus Eiseniibacteriota bacterium]